MKVRSDSAKYSINKIHLQKIRSRTALEKSNLALKGEPSRHKRPVKLPKLKFLEKKGEEPSRA